MTMRKISLEEATAQEMWMFADLTGLEIPEGVTLENAQEKTMRTILTTAGLKAVFVDDDDGVQQGRDPFGNVAPALLEDPEGRERWIMLQITPNPNGENSLAPIYVSVNHLEAWIPVGVIVVIREVLYKAFNAKEHRTPSAEHASGRNRRVSTAKAIEQVRHIHTCWGPVGFLKDGVPDIVRDREDIFPVADGASEMGSISRLRQKVLEAQMMGETQAA